MTGFNNKFNKYKPNRKSLGNPIKITITTSTISPRAYLKYLPILFSTR